MAFLFLALLFPLLLLNLIALVNALAFPRLRPASTGAQRVSLLIPARNEAAVIAETVRSLLAQDYPALEILILDDHSGDGTAEIALAAAAGDPRLRLFPGKPLPPGWLGKAWACQQLSEHATGELLIFTDADVRWQPGALTALVAHFEQTRADLLTIWPTQITHTWAERLVVPLMAFTIVGYLPILAVHHTPWPVFAAANGQCLVFRRPVYAQVGGHGAVRQNIVEDMGFAWAVKRAGRRLRMADGGGLLQTRMYANWQQVRHGFAKNILAGHANSLVFLLFSTFFHWALFLFPWLWLAFGWRLPVSPLYPWGPLGLAALGVSLRAITAAVSGQRLRDALFLPISVILMTVIAAQSVWWRLRGGPRWKGRELKLPKSSEP
jgi:chlorobactene glucosyltransferase